MKKLSFDLCEDFVSDNKNDFEDENTNEKRLKELERIVRMVIKAQLTNRQRQMIILYFYENKNMVEIAKMLNVNKSTVSRTIKRAINKISEYIKFYKIR